MTWVTRLSALLACLGWISAARAADSPVYTAFQTLCAAHQGAPGPALAAADAAGWATLNSAMVPMPQTGNFRMEHYDVRIHSDAGGKVNVLVVGTGEAMTGGGPVVPADICMLISKPEDAMALAQAQQWVSVPFTLAQGSLKAFMFSDTAQGHVPVPLASYGAALRRGAVNIVLIGVPPGSDDLLLGFMKPKPGP